MSQQTMFFKYIIRYRARSQIINVNVKSTILLFMRQQPFIAKLRFPIHPKPPPLCSLTAQGEHFVDVEN